MKRLLVAIALLITAQLTMAQTTVVNSLQVNTAKGTPPATVLPMNGGIAYIDANGMVKKSTVAALLGKKVDSALKLNDSTIQFSTVYGTYNVIIRGLYDLATKGFVDSVRTGLLKDTTYVKNTGASTIKLAFVSTSNDSIQVKGLKPATDITFVDNPSDTSVSGQLVATGVSPGTYGDATHIPQINIDANGRAHSIALIAITAGTSGALTKKAINSQSGTTYTIVRADTLTYITTTNSSAVTISIPDDATAAMSPPVILEVYQVGAGKVTIAPLNGNVTVVSPSGKFKTANQYSKIILNKISANMWVLSGDLDPTVGPFLSTNISSISGLTTVTGTASSSTSFLLNGTNLIGNATATAPTDYEVSTDNTTFSGSVSVTPGSGTISGVSIYVRIKASASVGTPSGNVVITSSTANTVNVAVSGTVTSVAASITTVGTLSAFSSVSGTASTTQTFTISGSNLIGSITITPPAGYELSSNGTTFLSSLTLTQSGGTLPGQPVTIYVRLSASNAAASYSGNIACTASGATTQNVAATGTTSAGTPTVGSTTSSLSGFSTSTGVASTPQSFSVTGSNLTANEVITAPGSYEVSLSSGSGYGSSVSITPSSGVVTATTVYVRITAAASVGSPSGNVVISSTGATPQNITVTGTVTTNTAVDTVVAQVFVAASTPTPISQWTAIVGNPGVGVVTVTDFTNYQPVTVRSIVGKWPGINSGSTQCAFNGLGNGSATMFPGGVCANVWIIAPNGPSTATPWIGFTAADTALAITGLDPTKLYTLNIASSRSDAIGCPTSPATTYIVDSTNGRVDSATVDAKLNNTVIQRKNKRPNAAGIIYLYPGPVYGGTSPECTQFGFINAVQVIKQPTREGMNEVILIGLMLGLLFQKIKRRRGAFAFLSLLLISTSGFCQIDSIVSQKIATVSRAQDSLRGDLSNKLMSAVNTVNSTLNSSYQSGYSTLMSTFNAGIASQKKTTDSLTVALKGIQSTQVSFVSISALIDQKIATFSNKLDSFITLSTTTTDSLQYTLDTLRVPNWKVGFFDVIVLQYNPKTGDAGSCEKIFVIKNLGNKYTVTYTGYVASCSGQGSLATSSFGVSVTSGVPLLKISGTKGQTIAWTAHYTTKLTQ